MPRILFHRSERAGGVPRGEWHRKAVTALRPPRGGAMLHLRRRCDRWEVGIAPGLRPERALRTLSATAQLMPPRVVAAYLRVLFDGLPTRQRFQQSGPCIFQCASGAVDSISHYAHCRVYHRLCGRTLGLTEPAYEHRLEVLLGLHTDETGLPASLRGQAAASSAAALRSLSLYALAMTHAASRHGAISPTGASDAFHAFIRDAVKGSPKACA